MGDHGERVGEKVSEEVLDASQESMASVNSVNSVISISSKSSQPRIDHMFNQQKEMPGGTGHNATLGQEMGMSSSNGIAYKSGLTDISMARSGCGNEYGGN